MVVGGFEIDAGGERCGNLNTRGADAPAGVDLLAADPGEVFRMIPDFQIGEIGPADSGIGEKGPDAAENGGGVGGDLLMIECVAQNEGLSVEIFFPGDHFPEGGVKILRHADKGEVAVPVIGMVQKIAGAAVRCAPDQKRRIAFVDSAPCDGGPDAESPENLGHLRDMSEKVGQVADRPRGASILPGDPASAQKIADQRLAGREQFVRHQVPGPDFQAPPENLTFQTVLPIRTNLGDVLQNDGLSIKNELLEFRVVFQSFQNFFRILQQHSPEILERTIPFPVPVRRTEITEFHGSILSFWLFSRGDSIPRNGPVWNGSKRKDISVCEKIRREKNTSTAELR